MSLAAGHPNPAAAERGAPPSPAAVLLAAGRGSRFHGSVPKLRAESKGEPLIRWAIHAVIASGLPGPYVVTGGADLTDLLDGATEVPNDDWTKGLATSLRAGIAAAARDGHDTVVVALADQPGISPDVWLAVASERRTPIAIATYDGVRGHPVRLAAEVWDDLPVTGEDGGRLLMREHPELVTEVPCSSGTALDIDTTEDLDQFNSPTRSA
ncbi:MAG TPA: nucleotidyltransferase family protein [Acidimicrobiales bacterium]|nr:nucleotidyltransferase family protein [Acidimicrobiales bacterium]